jgi:flagella basal body P-ring formation protein FlgA
VRVLACAWAVALLAGVTTSGVAAPLQGVESIEQAVRSFLQTQAPSVKGSVQVTVGSVDPRLQLAECAEPLQTLFAPGSRPVGNVTVGVRCPGPASWSIYVPARVEVHDRIVIINQSLPRGAVLSPEVLAVDDQDVTSLTGGYFTDPQAVIGKVTRRPVIQGTAVSQALLQEARLIKRGDRVSLVARGAGLEVRMEGEALEEGGRGEKIRVRNLNSRREVQGTVSGPGVVDIP